jgi:hypothetical protein
MPYGIPQVRLQPSDTEPDHDPPSSKREQESYQRPENAILLKDFEFERSAVDVWPRDGRVSDGPSYRLGNRSA